MSGDAWLCRDEKQLLFCFEHLRKYWDWSNPMSIKWQSGSLKSRDQLALCHIWIREIQKHMNKTPGNAFTEEEVKTWLKRKFGVIESGKDLISGERMPYLKSVGDYTKDEMWHFMNKLDVFAAEHSCVLSPGVGGYWYEREAA
jgi:hypothetical protein